MRFRKRPSPPLFSTTDVLVLVVSSRDCQLRHLGDIPFVCPADSMVPKQLPTVKAIAYRAVTFPPLFRIKLTRNNHCERGLGPHQEDNSLDKNVLLCCQKSLDELCVCGMNSSFYFYYYFIVMIKSITFRTV